MAYQIFSQVLKSLKISPDTRIGVAVSGGCDSMALALLAKQYFTNRITAITVDHQLRPDSREEALKVKDLLESRGGIEHEILTVQWPDGQFPTPGKVQSFARDQRYALLLNECAKRDLSGILLGHHGEDQIETFLLRICRTSGMMGLACMKPLFIMYGHPSVPIIRPLLTVKKKELMNICVNNGLKWIEDSTNAMAIYRRNVVRFALQRNLDIHDDMMDLVQLFQESREKCNKDILKALKSVKVDLKYGFVTMKYEQYRKLSVPVAKKLVDILLKFASNETNVTEIAPSTSNMIGIHRSILQKDPKESKISEYKAHGTAYGAIVYQHDLKSFAVARRPTNQLDFTPIHVGETILWDNRFYLKLDFLNSSSTDNNRDHSFYVRHMTQNDLSHANKGIRKVKAVKLPHVYCRNGLPVLVAEKEDVPKLKWPVIAIPILMVVHRKYGVSLKCSEFKPSIKLQDLQEYILQQSSE